MYKNKKSATKIKSETHLILVWEKPTYYTNESSKY